MLKLKLSVEGMGRTIYIVTEDGEYVAEVAVGKECFAKSNYEASIIADKIIKAFNDFKGEKNERY